MDEYIDEILQKMDFEFDYFGHHNSNIIEDSQSNILKLRSILNELRNKYSNFIFVNSEDEIFFFKEKKPDILSRLLFYNKIHQIETKFPNGSDEVIREYLHKELDNLTFYFDRNLDFYQYYRSRSTLYDQYYFVRGKADLKLGCDSSFFDKDPNFSTGYDYKVAKILANEMLRIYLNKRLQNLSKERGLEEMRSKYAKSPINFTGKKVWLIEFGYALANSGDFNNGRVEIKEMMDFLGAVFNVDLGDYYRTYIAIKDRKKDRTLYLTKLIEILEKKMDEDDSY